MRGAKKIFLYLLFLAGTSVYGQTSSKISDLIAKGKTTAEKNDAEAVSILSSAIEQAHEREEYESEIIAYFELAKYFKRGLSFSKGIHYDSLSYKIAVDHNLKKHIASTALVLSADLGRLRRFADAKELLLKHSKELKKYPEAKTKQAMVLGEIYMQQGYYDSALAQVQKGIQNSSDSLTSASLYMNLGGIYGNTGQHQLSYSNHLKGIQLFEEHKDNYHLMEAYFNMAASLGKAREREKSLVYSKKGLALAKRFNFPKIVCIAYNNIAAAYGELKSIDSALLYLHHVTTDCKSMLAPNQLASVYHNMGNLFENLGNVDSSIAYFQKAITIKKEHKLMGALALSYSSLGRVYSKHNRYNEGHKYLESAYAIFPASQKTSTSYLTLLKNYKNLCYNLGNYKDAYRLDIEHDQLKDSLFNVEKEKEAVRILSEAELSKKEAVIQQQQVQEDLLKQNIEQKNKSILYLVVAAILLLVVVIAVVYAIAISKKNQTRLEEKNRKIEALMTELDHRVKNNLQIMAQLLPYDDGQEAKETHQKARSRVEALLLLHQMLKTDQFGLGVNIKAYISSLAQYLIVSYGYDDGILKTQFKNVDDETISADKTVYVGLIVNEILTNVFKHAFPQHASPQLYIELEKKDRTLLLTILDNGETLNTDVVTDDNKGIRLIRLFTKQLHGEAEIKTGNGWVWTIKFPGNGTA